jgi:hypothetical protein
MRSEKVYLLTKLIKQKADQLMKEREVIEEHYKDVDYQQDCLKEELRHQYAEMLQEKADNEELFERKCKELEDLDRTKARLQKNFMQQCVDLNLRKGIISFN